MISENLIKKIKEITGDQSLTEYEDMALHTTLRMGGKARVFVTVKTETELLNLMNLLKALCVPYFIVGNGSNLLVSDDGYDGVIVSLKGDFDIVVTNGSEITTGAGVLLSTVSKKALDNELTGFEFASGIPGSVGGAITMNAGAYGGEMAQVVTGARIMVIPDSDEEIIIKDFINDDLHFSYRHSLINEATACRYIVLSVKIKLNKGNKEEISSIMNELNLKRREKQPLEYPSAGSTFKRPEGYFAAKLIEDAGLKGYSVGGAQVSEKHAGFCINKNHASATEFCELMKNVENVVFEKFGVRLEAEVLKLGDFK